MKARTIFLGFVVMATLSATSRGQGIEWALVNWKVRHDFPDVARIETQELHQWLADSRREQPLLLDVRTKAEYDLSHIHGAQRVEPGADPTRLHLPRDKPIVTYCSVGYRSAALAQKLKASGYSRVQNVSGSIFKWANEGYPIEHEGKPTGKVHPFNARWARLLRKDLRADVPPLTGAM